MSSSPPAGWYGAPPGPPPMTSTRTALIRLIVVVALGVVAAVVTNALPVLIVILALIAMVMIHELGHFLAAKASGMKVTEYFLGFGPRLWSIRRGETEYGVKGIPAGGYVRVVGMTTAEEIDPVDEPRSYRQATFPRRFLVGVAGSAMHFVMAFLLLFGLFVWAGVPTDVSASVNSLTSFSNAVSPAKAAGLEPGDVLVSVDGHRYSDADDFVTFVEDHAGQRVTLVVRRHGRLKTFHLTPLDGRTLHVKGQSGTLAPTSGPPEGKIGVELNFAQRNVTTNPLVAVQRSGALLGSLTKATVIGIGEVFSLHGLRSFAHQVATASNKPSSSSPSGNTGEQFVSIVGAVQIGAQAARENISDLLYLLVGINLFVGLVNLFPMLPLDGGHVVIAIYERIRSRRRRPAYHADVTKLMPFAYLFLLCMVVLGLGALYLNLLHPATLPGG